MKFVKLIGIVLGVFLTGLSACNNGADEELVQGKVITLTSEIASSRVSALDCQSTQIAVGRQVGVTIIGAKSKHENVVWLAGKGGALANTGADVFWNTTDATITAYHPYHTSWTGSNQVFSVNTDQSSDEGYLDSDLLWASTTASPSDHPVALEFTHKLTKICVILSSDDIADLSNAILTICGTNISTGFNPETGALTAVDGKVADIKMSVTTSTAYTGAAIIVPQKVVNGTKFVKVTYMGYDYDYLLSADMDFKPGRSYTFSLKMKKVNDGGPSIGIVFEEGDMTESDYELGL